MSLIVIVVASRLEVCCCVQIVVVQLVGIVRVVYVNIKANLVISGQIKLILTSLGCIEPATESVSRLLVVYEFLCLKGSSQIDLSRELAGIDLVPFDSG